MGDDPKKLTPKPNDKAEKDFDRKANVDTSDERDSLILDDGVGSVSGRPLLRSGDTDEASRKGR